MGSHGAFWWSCTGWGRGAPAWFTWISWLGAAPAAGGVQAQGLGSSRPLRIQGVAPCVLNTDNPPDRRQEVMRGAGWARASNLRDLYGCGWACTPSVQGGEARDRYQGPTITRLQRERGATPCARRARPLTAWEGWKARICNAALWTEPHQACYGRGDLPTVLAFPRRRSAAGAEDAHA